MSPMEIREALAKAVEQLGPDAHASIVLSGHGSPRLYVSVESSWQRDADKATFNNAQTFEEAIQQVKTWADAAPLRNRVMTAEDLWGAAA